MVFYICISLVMLAGFMMLFTIGEPLSSIHEADNKLIRKVSVILLIVALGIGIIFK